MSKEMIGKELILYVVNGLGSFEWNKANTVRLIKLYEQSPVLWNAKFSEYNVNTRKDALNKIAIEMGCSIEVIERKISTIRAQYFRQLSKIRKSNKHTSDPDEIYKPSWYGFDFLSFLKPFAVNCELKNRRNKSQVPQDEVVSRPLSLYNICT